MKRTLIFFTGMLLAMLILTGTKCNEAHQDDPGGSICGGYITALATGFINQELCFDIYGTYTYQENNTLNFSAIDEKEEISNAIHVYDIYINLDANNGPFNGTGTYECGKDKTCLITLYTYDFDGILVDTFVSVSGTITITKVDQNSFHAEFDTEFEDPEPILKKVNLSGSVVK